MMERYPHTTFRSSPIQCFHSASIPSYDLRSTPRHQNIPTPRFNCTFNAPYSPDFHTFITLLLFTFTFGFLLPHTTHLFHHPLQRHSALFTSLSAIGTALSASRKLLSLHCLPSLPFKQTPTFEILACDSYDPTHKQIKQP